MKRLAGGVLFSLVPLEFGSEKHGGEPAAEPGLPGGTLGMGQDMGELHPLCPGGLCAGTGVTGPSQGLFPVLVVPKL